MTRFTHVESKHQWQWKVSKGSTSRWLSPTFWDISSYSIIFPDLESTFSNSQIFPPFPWGYLVPPGLKSHLCKNNNNNLNLQANVVFDLVHWEPFSAAVSPLLQFICSCENRAIRPRRYRASEGSLGTSPNQPWSASFDWDVTTTDIPPRYTNPKHGSKWDDPQSLLSCSSDQSSLLTGGGNVCFHSAFSDELQLVLKHSQWSKCKPKCGPATKTQTAGLRAVITLSVTDRDAITKSAVPVFSFTHKIIVFLKHL